MTLFWSMTIWGFGAAAAAVFCEYLFRTLPGPWYHYIQLWVPLQLWIGFCIYNLVRLPQTSLIDALVVFSFSTLFLRVLVTLFVLGDRVRVGTWIALGLLLLARVSQTVWR